MTVFETGGPQRFDHQRRGLREMIRMGGVTALLMDPGLGKSAIVIDYASLLALKSPTGEARVLVVAPLAAVDTWVMQTATFASPQIHYWAEALGGSLMNRSSALASRGDQPFRNAPGRRKTDPPRMQGVRSSLFTGSSEEEARGIEDVPKPRLVLTVMNIDSFSSRAAVGSRTVADVMMDGVKRYAPDLIVIDESHRIKGATSNASRLLGRIALSVKRRIILTGTVMPHSPLDVFAQWRFLDPYAFGRPQPDGSKRAATFSNFRDRYAKLGGFMGREVVGYRDLDDMQEIMSRNAVVARKRDALDLPPTQEVTVPVRLSQRELRAYMDLKKQFAHEIEKGNWATVGNRLTQMMRLRQITSGFLPSDTKGMVKLGESKARTISSIIHDNLAGEKRIVVFCEFVDELDLLRKVVDRADTEVMVISGATPSQERQRLRQRFGSDDPARMVLLCQIKTMSLAVNELVTANHAIFGSLSQQRDDLVQARDRLDRIGQTRPVTFWYAIAPSSIDEIILKSHQERTNLETAVLRHVQGQEAAAARKS